MFYQNKCYICGSKQSLLICFVAADTHIMNIEQFKHNINTERKKRNKSIEDICRSLRHSRYWISKLSNPSLNTIVDIANAIGCTAADLMKDI